MQFTLLNLIFITTTHTQLFHFKILDEKQPVLKMGHFFLSFYNKCGPKILYWSFILLCLYSYSIFLLMIPIFLWKIYYEQKPYTPWISHTSLLYQIWGEGISHASFTKRPIQEATKCKSITQNPATLLRI